MALDSDAYPRLSWSSALITDEGFYIYNARNFVLFGTERMNEFNNVLLMPILHHIQVVVFRIFGVGAVQARLISVAFVMLTMPFFFWAIRRMFGNKVAVVAVLFYGLDHINLLYSRMALMDPPAVAVIVAALYTFTRSIPEGDQNTKSAGWAIVTGLLITTAFGIRSLVFLTLPAFLVGYTYLSWKQKRWHLVVGFLLGLVVGLTLYVWIWYLPNRTPINHYNSYYFTELIMPRSLWHTYDNWVRGLFDYHRGIVPYLLRRSPIQIGLSLCFIVFLIARRFAAKPVEPTNIVIPKEDGVRVGLLVFTVWFTTCMTYLLTVSYAPSRYFLHFYPAMAGIAAYSLFKTLDFAKVIFRHKALASLLGAYFITLSAQALRSRVDLLYRHDLVFITIGMAFALWIGAHLSRKNPTHRDLNANYNPNEIWKALISLWALMNLCWLGDWGTHLTYKQRETSFWLAANLPSNATLLGGMAPGLCMDNRLKVVNVIKELCNYENIVEKTPSPRYLLILDYPWREPWVEENYRHLRTKQRCLRVFPNLLRPTFLVSLYDANEEVEGNKAGDSSEYPD